MALLLKKFPGWLLETNERSWGSFNEWTLKKAVAGVVLGTLEFGIITPSRPVRGCVYMQFCQDESRKLHVEYAFQGEDRTSWVKCRDGVSAGELANLTADLTEKYWIPDTSRWEMMGCYTDRVVPAPWVEIVQCIGGEAAAEAFRPALSAPEAWYIAHQVQYAKRGIPIIAGTGTLLWNGMADLLLQTGHIAEVKGDPSLRAFLAAVRSLTSLPVEDAWFAPKASVARWCSALDRRWWDSGCCMGALDLRNGRLLLFVTTRTELGYLRELAQQIGQRIDLAKRIADS